MAKILPRMRYYKLGMLMKKRTSYLGLVCIATFIFLFARESGLLFTNVGFLSLGHATQSDGVDTGELAKSEYWFNRALAQRQSSWPSFGIGKAYVMQERYDDAVRVLERAIELQPQNAMLPHMLGTAYCRAGNRYGKTAAAAYWGRQEVLLTNNADMPGHCETSGYPAVSYLQAVPQRHVSGEGTIASELFDGITSGSGNPNWEYIVWNNGWYTDTQEVVVRLDDEALIKTVQVWSASPYPNYGLTEVEVWVQPNLGDSFRFAGNARQTKYESTQLNMFELADASVVGKAVKLVFKKAGDKTQMTVNEIRIWGYPNDSWH